MLVASVPRAAKRGEGRSICSRRESLAPRSGERLDLFCRKQRHTAAARMADEKRRQVDPRLAPENDVEQVIELYRIGVVGEEIEPLERLRILADPAARHVEAADRRALTREVV